MQGIAPTQAQALALGLVEVPEFHMGPFLTHVKIPLDCMPPLKRNSCTPQLGVTHKLAEGAVSPAIYVIDEGMK